MKSLHFIRTAAAVLGASLLVGALFAGCLNGAEPAQDKARLSISMKVLEGASTRLGKGSEIRLSKLVVTLRSSDPADPVIRDTVFADAGSGLSSGTAANQQVTRQYTIRPLRNWSVVVKTLDTRDSVIHRDSVMASSILIGETRTIPLDLSARYVATEVKFTVPDSLYSLVSLGNKNLTINRLEMLVDSVVVRDTTKVPEFLHGQVHTVYYDYIRSNTQPTVILQFYGRIDTMSTDQLLFRSTLQNVDLTADNLPVRAQYIGPQSGGNDATAKLMLNIGKVHTVKLDVGLQDTIPFKAAPRR